MNLINAMRTEFGRAQKFLFASLTVKGAILVGTLVSAALNENAMAAKSILVGAGIAQLLMFVFRATASTHQSLGNDLRLAALIENGLGEKPTAMQIAKWKDRVGKMLEVPTDSYYGSKLTRGPLRLIDITAESAYFTCSLAKKSAGYLLAAVGIAVLLLVYAFVGMVLMGNVETKLELIARIVILAVTFWLTDDLISMALAYREASINCERIVDKCDPYLDGRMSATESEAFRILSEYHGATSVMPPLPSLLYKRLNERLTKAWAAARGL